MHTSQHTRCSASNNSTLTQAYPSLGTTATLRVYAESNLRSEVTPRPFLLSRTRRLESGRFGRPAAFRTLKSGTFSYICVATADRYCARSVRSPLTIVQSLLQFCCDIHGLTSIPPAASLESLASLFAPVPSEDNDRANQDDREEEPLEQREQASEEAASSSRAGLVRRAAAVLLRSAGGRRVPDDVGRRDGDDVVLVCLTGRGQPYPRTNTSVSNFLSHAVKGGAHTADVACVR